MARDSLGAFTAGLRDLHFKGRSPKGRKLAAKAESARKRRVQSLRRDNADDPDAQMLAAKLAACRRGKRCLSNACPACAQAAQELFVDIVQKFCKEHDVYGS